MAARRRQGRAVDERARASTSRSTPAPLVVGSRIRQELVGERPVARLRARGDAARAAAPRTLRFDGSGFKARNEYTRGCERRRRASEVTWVISGDTTSFKAKLIAPMVQAKLQEKLDTDLARLRDAARVAPDARAPARRRRCCWLLVLAPAARAGELIDRAASELQARQRLRRPGRRPDATERRGRRAARAGSRASAPGRCTSSSCPRAIAREAGGDPSQALAPDRRAGCVRTGTYVLVAGRTIRGALGHARRGRGGRPGGARPRMRTTAERRRDPCSTTWSAGSARRSANGGAAARRRRAGTGRPDPPRPARRRAARRSRVGRRRRRRARRGRVRAGEGERARRPRRARRRHPRARPRRVDAGRRSAGARPTTTTPSPATPRPTSSGSARGARRTSRPSARRWRRAAGRWPRRRRASPARRRPSAGRRASSTRATGRRRATSSGRRRTASRAWCRPARPTRCASRRATTRRPARSSGTGSACRTGRPARPTRRSRAATSAASAAGCSRGS